MTRAQTTAIALSAAALCAVGVSVAGPLNPPAGPVAQTDPDLGQILSAVNGLGGDSCGNHRAEPGIDVRTHVTMSGIATFDVLEFTLGASRTPLSGGGHSQPMQTEIRMVRLYDSVSPRLFERLMTGVVIPTCTIELVSPPSAQFRGYRLRNVVLESIESKKVVTCDGDRLAEVITLRCDRMEFENDSFSYSWDFDTNMPG